MKIIALHNRYKIRFRLNRNSKVREFLKFVTTHSVLNGLKLKAHHSSCKLETLILISDINNASKSESWCIICYQN